MGELRKQTVSGIKWLVGGSFAHKGISLATTVILARLLSPTIFGLYALAFVAIDALGLFKSMGFDTALIRRKDDIDKAANTAFFIIPVLGFFLYLTLTISAPTIGKFLNNQEVVGVIKALGLIFVISCFGNVPKALMERNMQFKKVSVIEITTGIIYSVVAVSLAILKIGVWSLVIAYILKTIYQNIMLFVISKWRPKFEFDKKIALEMFHFGKFIFLGSTVAFFRMNLDNLLVGKLLGVTALGLYAIAFNIANFCVDYFAGKVQRVTFPAYSKLQSDMGDLRVAYLKVFKHTSLIVLPFSIGLFLLGGEFLRFVYGEKWVGATGVLKILAFGGLFNALPASISGLFLACGKPKLTFYITILQIAIFLIFITPMARLFGINGVGLVVSTSGLIVLCIALFWASKLLAIKLNNVYVAFRPALYASIIMALAIIYSKYFLSHYKIKIMLNLNFILLSTIALIIYFVSLNRIEKSIFKNIKRMVFS